MSSGKTRAAVHLFLSGTLLASASLTLLSAPASAEPPSDAKATPAPATEGRPGPPTLSTGPSPSASHVPGEVLVRFERGASAAARASARSRVGAELERKLPVPGLELLKVPGVDAAVSALEHRPGVAYAEPNYVYRASSTPNDPRFPRQWALNNTGQTVRGHSGARDADIDAPETWDSITGKSRVVVASVDGGVATRHPDLKNSVWTNPRETLDGRDDDGNGYVDDVHGWDWIDGDNKPEDITGHGTHVAGTIAAQGDNGRGVTGVSWDASIMPLRVLDPTGSGTTADLVEAITYARDAGADVLNASLGGPENSRALRNAIAGAPDMLVVVSAGNDGTDNDDASTPIYPCDFPASNLLCVAATNSRDRLAGFSNYGAGSVDLGAPGVDILSTLPPLTRPFREFFGRGTLGKLTSGGTSTWGTQKGYGTGPHASDSVRSRYAPNTDTRLRTSRAIDLSNKHGCRLDFLLMLNTEKGYDFLSVEARRAGGSWRSLGQVSGRLGATWYPVTAMLDDFDGRSRVHFRFRLRSDGSNQYDGVRIDNVVVHCVSNTYDGNEYGFASGTSMAAPQVTGAAALLFAAAPGATATDVRQALLAGVDTKSSLAGKTVTGGRLNVKKALDRIVPIVQHAKAAASVREDAGEVSLNVTRTGVIDKAFTVDYATSDGTAAAGSDYTATNGTLSFAAGQRTATITVPITDDTSYDGDATFDVALSAPTGGALLGARTHAKVKILEDESVLRFGAATGSVDEDAGTASVTVERVGGLDSPVTVDYATADDTAVAGTDYSATSGTLSFAAGQSEATIDVPVADDTTYQGDRTFDVQLSGPTGSALLGKPATTKVSITEDDLADLAFSRKFTRVNERAGQVDLQVVRTGNTALPVTVDYAVGSGTATAGSDFDLEPGTLSFAEGETAKTITVAITDDNAREAAETIGVSLSNPSETGALGSPSTSTVRITPSDQQPDALISNAKRRNFVGNDIYNVTGRHQTRFKKSPRSRSRNFYVRISNDGNVRNLITVKGSGTRRGAGVRYFSGGNDITNAMRSSNGWRVRLAADHFRLIRVRVTVFRGAEIDSRKPFKVRGIWVGDGRRVDAVKGVVRVIR